MMPILPVIRAVILLLPISPAIYGLQLLFREKNLLGLLLVAVWVSLFIWFCNFLDKHEVARKKISLPAGFVAVFAFAWGFYQRTA